MDLDLIGHCALAEVRAFRAARTSATLVPLMPRSISRSASLMRRMGLRIGQHAQRLLHRLPVLDGYDHHNRPTVLGQRDPFVGAVDGLNDLGQVRLCLSSDSGMVVIMTGILVQARVAVPL